MRPTRSLWQRTVVADHASNDREADLPARLRPRRSPAFSAALCNGVAWLFGPKSDENRDLIDRVYLRYVREGRAEPWVGRFGHECPEPRFD